MEYYLKGIGGDVLISEEESLAVSGNSQISKSFFIPKDVKSGDYVFSAVAKYKSSVGSSSYLLNIDNSGAYSTTNYILMWVASFFVLIVIVLIVWYIKVGRSI